MFGRILCCPGPGTTENLLVAVLIGILLEINLTISNKVDDEQGGLACCGSWGHKELDATERLN